MPAHQSNGSEMLRDDADVTGPFWSRYAAAARAFAPSYCAFLNWLCPGARWFPPPLLDEYR